MGYTAITTYLPTYWLVPKQRLLPEGICSHFHPCGHANTLGVRGICESSLCVCGIRLYLSSCYWIN